MVWSGGGDEREVSWLDWSTVADLSADGKTILFYEWGEGVGAVSVSSTRERWTAGRVRLGAGKALALSPDGRWALALQETRAPQLVLLPTGTGVAASGGGLTDFFWARWFPDGRRILVVGSGADAVPAPSSRTLETGKLEPIAKKGCSRRCLARRKEFW